jgi:hypothetical protein
MIFSFNRQVYKLSGSLYDAGFVDSKKFVEMFSGAVSIPKSIQKVSELNV